MAQPTMKLTKQEGDKTGFYRGASGAVNLRSTTGLTAFGISDPATELGDSQLTVYLGDGTSYKFELDGAVAAGKGSADWVAMRFEIYDLGLSLPNPETDGMLAMPCLYEIRSVRVSDSAPIVWCVGRGTIQNAEHIA